MLFNQIGYLNLFVKYKVRKGFILKDRSYFFENKMSFYNFMSFKIPTLLRSASKFSETSETKFLSAKAVIPLTLDKIASSGGFGPQKRSFPLYRSPLKTSFTVSERFPNLPIK